MPFSREDSSKALAKDATPTKTPGKPKINTDNILGLVEERERSEKKAARPQLNINIDDGENEEELPLQ